MAGHCAGVSESHAGPQTRRNRFFVEEGPEFHLNRRRKLADLVEEDPLRRS